MEMLSGFPFLPLEFTKEGQPTAGQKAALLAALGGDLAATANLVVISHGWNNDMAEARQLYAGLLANMRAKLDAGPPAGARPGYAVLGIFWPSKKFADADLIPASAANGGAMGLGNDPLPDGALGAAAARLADLLEAPDEEAAALAALAERVGDGAGAKRAFVHALRALLPIPADPQDDRSGRFFSADGEALIDAFRAPIMIRQPQTGGGAAGFRLQAPPADAAGAAAGLGSFFSGAKAAALRLLNFTTYYAMKERAGIVGLGLNRVLGEVRAAHPALRIHLIGHSFGARAVTAAVNGATPFRPSSLSLLQGAFSHNGFAADVSGSPGFFRQVIAGHKVAGPIIATHTQNDLAVGVAYALASRLSGDNRSSFGDATDQFGGIGRNGAMRLADAERVMATLQADSFAYPAFAAGVVQNLKADAFVKGHSDVTNAAVANAVVHAIG